MLPNHAKTAERLLFLRESTAVKDLLAKVEAVRFVGFVSGDDTSPNLSEIWKHISPLASQPDDVREIRDDDNFSWLEDYTRLLNIQKQYYLSLAGYSLPWIELEIIHPFWLHELAKVLNPLDLILMHLRPLDTLPYWKQSTTTIFLSIQPDVSRPHSHNASLPRPCYTLSVVNA